MLKKLLNEFQVEGISLTLHDGGVCKLTLNKPDKYNPINFGVSFNIWFVCDEWGGFVGVRKNY